MGSSGLSFARGWPLLEMCQGVGRRFWEWIKPESLDDFSFEDEATLRARQAAAEVRECLRGYLDVHAQVGQQVGEFIDDGYKGTPEQALLFAFSVVARSQSGWGLPPEGLVAASLKTFDAAMLGGDDVGSQLDLQQRVLHDVFSTLSAVRMALRDPYPGAPLLTDYVMSFFYAGQALRCVQTDTLGHDGTQWSHRLVSLGAKPQAG